MLLERLTSWLRGRPAEGHLTAREQAALIDRFRSIIEIERMRADRTGSEFSLVVFLLGDGDDGQAEMNRFLSELKPRLRATDHYGFTEDGRVAVILCDSSESGTWSFIENTSAAWKGSAPLRYEVYRYPTYKPPEEDSPGNETEADDTDKATPHFRTPDFDSLPSGPGVTPAPCRERQTSLKWCSAPVFSTDAYSER